VVRAEPEFRVGAELDRRVALELEQEAVRDALARAAGLAEAAGMTVAGILSIREPREPAAPRDGDLVRLSVADEWGRHATAWRTPADTGRGVRPRAGGPLALRRRRASCEGVAMTSGADTRSRASADAGPRGPQRLSPFTLVFASLGSVIATALVSRFGLTGTVVGAALTPVVIALVGEVRRPVERIVRLPGGRRVLFRRRPGVRWRIVAITAGAAFAVAVAAFTIPDLITGESAVSKRSTTFFSTAPKTPATETPGGGTTTTEPATTTAPEVTTQTETTTVTAPETTTAPAPVSTAPAPEPTPAAPAAPAPETPVAPATPTPPADTPAPPAGG
jgi:hypothetical protein